MGLFDTIREKAAELLSGVTEKAGDLAGDLPGAEMLEDLSQSASDAASGATDEAAGTVQDLGASATEAGADATDAVTDATDTFTDTPGEPPQP
jgi:uncharacterized protein YjbJ (UPF0337 family)